MEVFKGNVLNRFTLNNNIIYIHAHWRNILFIFKNTQLPLGNVLFVFLCKWCCILSPMVPKISVRYHLLWHQQFFVGLMMLFLINKKTFLSVNLFIMLIDMFEESWQSVNQSKSNTVHQNVILIWWYFWEQIYFKIKIVLCCQSLMECIIIWWVIGYWRLHLEIKLLNHLSWS